MIVLEDKVISLLQKRSSIYAFFKVIYEKEISAEFLSEMPKKIKPLLDILDSFSDTESRKTIRDLVRFIETFPSQDLNSLKTRLDADYARLFLCISKIPPHPSESIYRDGMMMQHSRDEVLKTYWSFGVDKIKEFTEPEDHVAVELSFMEYLCKKAIEALNNRDIKEAKRYIKGQKDFLEKHLSVWVPKLEKDILCAGKTPFYKGFAVLTTKFIEMDLLAAKDLLKDIESIGGKNIWLVSLL